MAFKIDVEKALTDTLREWSVQWDASIQDNFRNGGRPKWQPSKREGATLVDTNKLAQSIQVRPLTDGQGKFRVIASSNMPYARIHQYGGTIKSKGKKLAIPLTPKARKLKPEQWPKGSLFPVNKNGKYTLCITKGKGKRARVEAQYVLKDEVKMPARPFLVVQREDKDLLKKTALRHLKGDKH